jgi:hypothetical protein
MTSRIVVILPALINSTPMLRISLYLAEEIFVVLIAIAAVLVLASVFAIGLVLFSNGTHIGFLWLKEKVVHFVEAHHYFGQHKAVVHPSPRRG